MTAVYFILLESDALLYLGSTVLAAGTIQRSSPSPSLGQGAHHTDEKIAWELIMSASR